MSVAAPAPPRPRRRARPARPATSLRPVRTETHARPRGAGLTRGGLVWLVALTTLLGGLVALNVAVLSASIDVNRLSVQAQQVGQSNRGLNTTVASLSSPARITAMAHHYNMIQPVVDPHNYLHLRLGRHAGSARTAR